MIISYVDKSTNLFESQRKSKMSQISVHNQDSSRIQMALAINFLYNQIKNVQNGKKRTLSEQFQNPNSKLTETD